MTIDGERLAAERGQPETDSHNGAPRTPIGTTPWPGRPWLTVNRWGDVDRATLSTAAFALFVLLCSARLLTVDLAGVLNNDSLTYVREADSPFVDGLVHQGYRQVGYSLWIAFSNVVGGVFGWDHIFGVALLQRLILAIGLALVASALRWWSAPVLIFATTASYIVVVDYLLIEGLVIPLCVVMGGLVAIVAVGKVTSIRSARSVLVSVCLLAAACAALKLQYLAVLAPAAAIAWLLHRDGLLSRRLAIVALGSVIVFGGVVAGAQAAENHSELGVFEPVAERHRSRWWGAWQAVFVHRPGNVDDPSLAEYYDDGNLYTFLHGIERSVPDYGRRRQIIEDRTDAMLDAAGISPREEQFAAFLGALRGGRSNDLGRPIASLLAATSGDPVLRLSSNSVYQEDGPEAAIQQFNAGVRPGIMTTGPVFDFSQRRFDDFGVWRSRISVSAIALMAGSLFFRGRHRPVAVATLSMMVVGAAAMGSNYTDNARYLLGPLTLGVVGGVLGLKAMVRSIWDRRLGRSTVDPGRVEDRSQYGSGGTLDDHEHAEAQ